MKYVRISEDIAAKRRDGREERKYNEWQVAKTPNM